MRVFIKYLLIFFFSLFLFPHTQQAFADDITVSDDTAIRVLINGVDPYQEPDKYTKLVITSVDTFEDKNSTALIKITGLDSNEEYYVCGKFHPGDCNKDRNKSFKSESDGTISIRVCGDGEETLKGHGVKSDGKGGETNTNNWLNAEKGCNDKTDYFHEGHAYKLHLFQDKSGDVRLISAEFYVQHSYPTVNISPKGGGTFGPRNGIIVSLFGRRPRSDKDNNYQTVLEGPNYKDTGCITTKIDSGPTQGFYESGIENTDSRPQNEESITSRLGQGTPGTYTYARGKGGAEGLGPGNFLLKINERVNDSRPLGLGKHCEGGHTYMHIKFRIDNNGLKVTKVEYDPNEVDAERQVDAFPALKQRFPCAAIDPQTKRCTELKTAIGNIGLTPQKFLTSIFTTVLSISGFGALIIIIYGGYLFMTSRGNKEKISAARDTITAAILGLLFIIFSIVILKIIGVDVLRIPGFGPVN